MDVKTKPDNAIWSHQVLEASPDLPNREGKYCFVKGRTRRPTGLSIRRARTDLLKLCQGLGIRKNKLLLSVLFRLGVIHAHKEISSEPRVTVVRRPKPQVKVAIIRCGSTALR